MENNLIEICYSDGVNRDIDNDTKEFLVNYKCIITEKVINPYPYKMVDFRGDYEGSDFPSSGGSGIGESGMILKGDMWYNKQSCKIGIYYIPQGASIIAKIDNPGQNANNWTLII